jgi:Flagellar P-ring protein
MQFHSRIVVFRTYRLILPCAFMLIAFVGCLTPWVKKPEPESAEARKSKRERIKEILASDNRPWLLSEIAQPKLLTISRMENLGLVTCLAATGGTVEAGTQRERMLDIMRRNNAAQPNQLLDSPDTTMVVAFANIPPAARRGAILNVGVQKSTHAEGTSLKMGWLMPTELAEASLLEDQLRTGFDMVAAEGAIVTQAQVTGKNEENSELIGTVVGGGRLFKDRPLGITIIEEFSDAFTQAKILAPINERFTYFNGQKKGGVATPIKDNYLELAIPPRYEHDPYHYINVVLSCGFLENAEHRAARLEQCKRELLDPRTARQSAWQLEAIGKDGIPALEIGMKSPDPEVRFYSAYSLAYLNDHRAAGVLARLAPQQAAFRAMCLNGLSIIDHYEAESALEELLHAADAETRFGAMRALRQRDPNSSITTGMPIEKVGSILEIPSAGPPLVAISLEKYPEIVIFGNNPQVQIPNFYYVNPRILIKSDSNGVTINRFAPNEDDRVIQCNPDLVSLLRGIAEVGGSYGDWVSFIRECSEQKFLAEPLAMNPIPASGRVYDREKRESVDTINDVDDVKAGAASDEAQLAAKAEKAARTTWYNPFSWFSN